MSNETTAAPRTKKRRGFGIASFVLALLTVLSYVAVVLIMLGIPGGFGVLGAIGLGGWGLTFAMMGFVFVVCAIAYFGAFVTSALSLLFGIIGFVYRSGRVLSVIGVLLSVVILVFNVWLFLDIFIPEGQ
jgi:hypothetical protein